MRQEPAPPPPPPPAPGRELGVGYKYVGLGCTFAGGIVLFMAGGWALDRWLRLTPLFTIIGTLLGAVLSFLHVYWRLASEGRSGDRSP
jgi:F0F1-type ATP synthase assembly protein I